MPQSPKFIEVFAGCGGMSSGLIQAGMSNLHVKNKQKDAILQRHVHSLYENMREYKHSLMIMYL